MKNAGSAPELAQRADQHPGRGRLPVRAGDGDQPALGAELGEQPAAMEDLLAALARADELGVVVRDRARDHDLGVSGHGVGVVPDAWLEPGGPEPLEVAAAFGPVRPGDAGAELIADEREAAHPGAADRDEVELALGPVHCQCTESSLSTSAATRSAASGIASEADAALIAASR